MRKLSGVAVPSWSCGSSQRGAMAVCQASVMVPFATAALAAVMPGAGTCASMAAPPASMSLLVRAIELGGLPLLSPIKPPFVTPVRSGGHCDWTMREVGRLERTDKARPRSGHYVYRCQADASRANFGPVHSTLARGSRRVSAVTFVNRRDWDDALTVAHDLAIRRMSADVKPVLIGPLSHAERARAGPLLRNVPLARERRATRE